MPSPGSLEEALILISFPFSKVILNEEKPLISASEIVNVPDDWFPNEFKFIDFVVDGIEVTEPSFKKL